MFAMVIFDHDYSFFVDLARDIDLLYVIYEYFDAYIYSCCSYNYRYRALLKRHQSNFTFISRKNIIFG
jgi:hypothetical protein